MSLGNKIKETVYKAFAYDGGEDIDNLDYVISRAEVISFDIFDTLVKRNVQEPRQVHQIVEQEFYRQTGKRIPEYVNHRVDSEEKARKCSTKEEIHMEDIFSLLSGIPDEWKRRLQELEKQIEIKISTPNLKMKAVYDKVIKAGKKIIITSDMYLDQETVRQILCKCGYDGFEKMYLSSSLGLCKAKGSIYEVIKKDYPHDHILHIGDHIRSDYFVPRKRGIDAILINRNACSLRFWRQKGKYVTDQLLY